MADDHFNNQLRRPLMRPAGSTITKRSAIRYRRPVGSVYRPFNDLYTDPVGAIFASIVAPTISRAYIPGIKTTRRLANVKCFPRSLNQPPVTWDPFELCRSWMHARDARNAGAATPTRTPVALTATSCIVQWRLHSWLDTVCLLSDIAESITSLAITLCQPYKYYHIT